MTAHSERALAITSRLQELGLDISYPGLPDHPDHELFKDRHCAEYGYGGVFTLDVGNEETANWHRTGQGIGVELQTLEAGAPDFQ